MSQEGARGPENREERRFLKNLIHERLTALRLGPFDVLVLHIPSEVIADQTPGGLFDQAQAGAREVMEVAGRGVILLPEGTEMTAQSVEPFLRKLMEEATPGEPELYVPNPDIILPGDPRSN